MRHRGAIVPLACGLALAACAKFGAEDPPPVTTDDAGADGSTPDTGIEGGGDGAVSADPCRPPMLLCLDFETPVASPWAAFGEDKGKWITFPSARTGKAAFVDVPRPVMARRDAFSADVGTDFRAGITLEMDVELVAIPHDQFVPIAVLVGENQGFSIELVFEGAQLKVAENRDGATYQIHPKGFAPRGWQHVVLRAFDQGSPTVSLTVDGTPVESGPLVNLPAAGPGKLLELWVGLLETDPNSQSSEALQLRLDNVRLTSP